MVYSSDDIDDLIINATPDLLGRLKLDVSTLSKLRKAGVLTESLEDELKTDGLTPNTKISKFLDDLRTGPIERFLNFCQIMKEGDQYHIVEYLRADMTEIYAQLGVPTVKMQPHLTENNNVSSRVIPLWEKEHPNADAYLCDDEDLEMKLVEGMPKLKRLLRTKELWVFVHKYHIMDELMVENCQVGTRGDHVEAIIKLLRQGEVWRTHAFLRCLAQTDQAGLIDQVLGKGHKAVYMENLLEK